ncbi:MAG: phosphoribosylglycinamide formyltransferase [Mesorhizobium amorphae]|nr:MAG: phosphoribosylglycinamide formyltransferase [Mesorhizobium amorphae]
MSAVKRAVGVLISGRGSNMAALAEAAKETDFPARIALVVSDQPDAAGLAYARQAGIPARAVPRGDFGGKAEHEAAITAALREAGAEIVCLAGYMRLLSDGFVAAWRGRLLNIHPSLLPAFPGLDTHRRALEAGVRLHGCTVHFVSEEMDAGPIVAQGAVPVVAGDTEDDLARRVLGVEHKLYPMALRMVAEGAAKLEDDRVVLSGGGAETGTLLSPEPHSRRSFEDLARLTP